MSDEQQSFFVEDNLKLEERLSRIERHLLELESKYEHLVEAWNAGKFAFKLSDHNLMN
jgi:hypothetical protein